jgi:hypothetical protein
MTSIEDLRQCKIINSAPSEDVCVQDEYREEANSVIGSDFYNATDLLGLSDEQIVAKVLKNVQRCDPRALQAKVAPLFPLCNHIVGGGWVRWRRYLTSIAPQPMIL